MIETLGKIAGLAGISIGLLIIVFRQVIQKQFFSTLSHDHSYKILRLVVILAFVTAIFGILIWAYSNSKIHEAADHQVTRDTTSKIDTSKILMSLDRYYYENTQIDDTLELTDFTYNQPTKSIELKIRNTSKNTAFVTKVRLSIFPPQHIEFGYVKKADTFVLNIDTAQQQKAYESLRYLYLDDHYDISYTIGPNDVARIAFILNFDLSKFYFPAADRSYEFKLTLYYNKTKGLLMNGYLRNDSIIVKKW